MGAPGTFRRPTLILLGLFLFLITYLRCEEASMVGCFLFYFKSTIITSCPALIPPSKKDTSARAWFLVVIDHKPIDSLGF